MRAYVRACVRVCVCLCASVRVSVRAYVCVIHGDGQGLYVSVTRELEYVSSYINVYV